MSTTLVGAAGPAGPQPSDLHAERAALGSMLVHRAISAHLTILLKVGDFSDPFSADLFSAITALHARGIGISPQAVTEELRRRNSTLDVDFVRMVASQAAHATVALYYATIIRDLAALRRYPHGPTAPSFPPMPMRGFLSDDDE